MIPALLALAALAPAPARAELFRLAVTGDTSISAYPSERAFNAGAAPRLKLKGLENLVLVSFDPARLGARVVTRAVLRFRTTAPDAALRWIGISTVAVAWGEGAGNYAAAPGATFLGPGPGARWGGPESDFTDAVFGRSGTIWTRTEAARGADGWWTLGIEPRLIEAVAAGLSRGLALSDDSGQTRANNYIFSREQSGAEPWLEIEAGEQRPVFTAPPSAGIVVGAWSAGVDEAHGGVVVDWGASRIAGPASALLGYRVRIGVGRAPLAELPPWMVPAPAAPGLPLRIVLPALPPHAAVVAEVLAYQRGGSLLAIGTGAGFASGPGPRVAPPVVRRPPRRPAVPPAAGGFTAWAVPDGAKVNPVNGHALDEPGVSYTGTPAGTWRHANPAWSSGGIRLAALRGEWIACSLVVEGRGAFRVLPGDLAGPRGAKLSAGDWSLAVHAYQHLGSGAADWYADPLIPYPPGDPVTLPLGGAFAPPAQRNQAFYMELFVPESATPGAYTGFVEVRPAAGAALRVPVTLTVEAGRIPRAAHFVFSLNGYEPPEPEREYYALAHEHRATLAILHYSHSGNYAEGAVPAVTGAGAAARVADWSAWDERFGPLFDGSAFAGTRRPGVPLDHFYLALCEHYPTPMAGAYRWNDVPWEDHWRLAGPIEEGFSPEWRDRWIAVARDYAAHIRARGWATAFQVFNNDKYDFKRVDPATGRSAHGTSFWELDEPVHPDDWLALRFFGDLLRVATGGGGGPLRFRADISTPQWGRNLLDPVLDLEVSAAWPAYRRLLDDASVRMGRTLWTYGSTPPATASALAISAQALALWTGGMDDYVPWLVLATPAQWTTGGDTAVIYPASGHPAASLRLKAYRRAEQDVEYAWLWNAARGLAVTDPGRCRIGGLLAPLLEPGPRDPAPAADAARLETFRRTLAAAL